MGGVVAILQKYHQNSFKNTREFPVDGINRLYQDLSCVQISAFTSKKNGLKFSISMTDIFSLGVQLQVQKKDVYEKDGQKIGGFLSFFVSAHRTVLGFHQSNWNLLDPKMRWPHP